METNSTTKIHFDRGNLNNDTLRQLYLGMLQPRMIEEKMLLLLRQGRISKWFSGIGQEAISVGATLSLLPSEMIFPMHRNLGVFTSRHVSLHELFGQWQGKVSGYTKGRDRSFHFGIKDKNITGMISHLGPQLSLASGVALAHKIRKEERVSLAFTGEGGTSEGEFHEALNVAAVWQLPVIFIIENNGYGLSTPTSEQYKCEQLADRGKGYGMRSLVIDGNNILEVYQTISKIANELREHPEPVLIECMTFRQRGHEEASGTKYVPKELMAYWKARDPLHNYEDFLISDGVIDEAFIENARASIKGKITEGLRLADQDDLPKGETEEELNDVFAPSKTTTLVPKDQSKKEMRFIDAISNGLDLAMQRHGNLVLMGQDIADYGGVFKITDGFLEKYGSDRVRNTPLCESAIVGIGLGLSLKGMKAMVEMQFADFVTCGFNQIVNNLAKIHYRWGANADVVIRMPCGGGVGAGPFHSQTNEAWFYKTPGLKIVYPSNPVDAKGLLLASFEDPNPVLFFEHKALYRKITAPVHEDVYTIKIGEAAIVQEGSDLTIITYGLGVHWAIEVAETRNESIEIIDLRSLSPIDFETIEQSVIKTHRVLILHEDTLAGGIGGDISAHISEHLFKHLDAPVVRVASLDTPFPFAKPLEENYLGKKRLAEKIEFILEY